MWIMESSVFGAGLKMIDVRGGRKCFYQDPQAALSDFRPRLRTNEAACHVILCAGSHPPQSAENGSAYDGVHAEYRHMGEKVGHSFVCSQYAGHARKEKTAAYVILEGSEDATEEDHENQKSPKKYMFPVFSEAHRLFHSRPQAVPVESEVNARKDQHGIGRGEMNLVHDREARQRGEPRRQDEEAAHYRQGTGGKEQYIYQKRRPAGEGPSPFSKTLHIGEVRMEVGCYETEEDES